MGVDLVVVLRGLLGIVRPHLTVLSPDGISRRSQTLTFIDEAAARSTSDHVEQRPRQPSPSQCAAIGRKPRLRWTKRAKRLLIGRHRGMPKQVLLSPSRKAMTRQRLASPGPVVPKSGPGASFRLTLQP